MFYFFIAIVFISVISFLYSIAGLIVKVMLKVYKQTKHNQEKKKIHNFKKNYNFDMKAKERKAL